MPVPTITSRRRKSFHICLDRVRLECKRSRTQLYYQQPDRHGALEMRRGSAVVVIVMVFGAVAVQLRAQLPSYSVELRYSARPLPQTLARWPRYAIEVRYHAGLLDRVLALLRRPRQAGERSVATALPDFAPKLAQPAPEPRSAAAPSAQPTGEAPAPKAEGVGTGPKVALDVARIAPDGTSVFAGRTEPGASVTVLDGATPVGTATADASGEWSLATEHKFPTDDPNIAVRAQAAPPDAGAPGPEVRAAAKSDGGPPAPINAEPAREPGPEPAPTGEAQAPSASARLVQELERTVEAARQEARQEARHSILPDAPAAEPITKAPEVAAATAPGLEAKAAPPPAAEVKHDVPPPAVITPLPLQFVYKEATLTDDGRQALTLLIEYLKLKGYGTVILSGHADERGEPDYNMDLSRQRLATIERLLRQGGFAGKIELVPKGESEPFTGIDRARFPTEDLMQLDRRVELRVAR
jgi:outer membrane protein OmpA-like peptidoglycan-associated protein